MYNISNLKNRLKANAFLSNIAFCIIFNLFYTISYVAKCFYISFLKANLIIANEHLPYITQTNYMEGKSQNSIFLESIIISILN